MSGSCADCGGPDYQTLEARIAELEAELEKEKQELHRIRMCYPGGEGEELLSQAEAERDTLREALRICYEEGWPSTENEHPWLRNDPEHLEPPEYERAMTPDEFVESVASGQPREGGEG